MLLNCDLGESFGAWQMSADAQVMPHIDMANIACGFHAGDFSVMVKTVALAKQHQVKIGAHPSYPDLQGFGRRSIPMSAEEIEAMLLYQLGALSGICHSQNVALSYVKPHGALYNDMMKDDALLQSIFTAINKFNADCPLVIMATANNAHYQKMADAAGISILFEAFADRAYDDQGFLVPRSQKNAVLHSCEHILSQAKQIKDTATVTSIHGNIVSLAAQTLCIHGDNADAVAMIVQLKNLFEK